MVCSTWSIPKSLILSTIVGSKLYIIPSFTTMILEPLKNVSVDPTAEESADKQVKKQMHIPLAMFNAEATCWSKDSIHLVAQAVESGNSNVNVSAGSELWHVAFAMGEITENMKISLCHVL